MVIFGYYKLFTDHSQNYYQNGLQMRTSVYAVLKLDVIRYTLYLNELRQGSWEPQLICYWLSWTILRLMLSHHLVT